MNQYKILTDYSSVSSVLDYLLTVKCFSFDIESTGLDPFTNELLGIGFSWKAHTGVYIPWRVREKGLWISELEYFWNENEGKDLCDGLIEIFSNVDVVKIAHDVGFDSYWLSIKFKIKVVNSFCTKFCTYIQNPELGEKSGNELSLGYLVDKNFSDLKGLKNIWKSLKGKRDKDLSLYYSTEVIGEYCCKDSDAALRLYESYSEDIKGKSFEKVFINRLMPSVGFLNRVRERGFLIDRDYLNAKRNELKIEKKELLLHLQDSVEDKSFNPNSEIDLKSLFFENLKTPRINEDHLDEPVLEYYRDKLRLSIAGDILKYRQLVKLISTYFDGIERVINPVTGRVHADFKLWVARTGRLSCRNPNLQNLPVKVGSIVKRMFIASSGYVLVGGDYSQIELRLIAWRSGDKVLLDAFERGVDVHILTASESYSISVEEVTEAQRFLGGKTTNFALMYGGKAGVLVRLLGNKLMGVDVPDSEDISEEVLYDRAKEFRRKYFSLYKGILPWTRRVIKDARRNGYVTSAYGRIMYLPNIRSTDSYLRSHSEKQAVNMDPQSTASDYSFFRFQDVVKEVDDLGLEIHPLNLVHDQIIPEVPEDNVEKVCGIMREVGVRRDEANIDVPMVLEPSWGKSLDQL